MTFSDMNRKEKIEHIWEYYKLQIFVGLFTVFVIGSLLNLYIINPAPDTILDISVRAGYYDYDAGTLMAEELTNYIVAEGENEVVAVEFLQVGSDIDANTMMASEAKFVAKFEIDQIDLLLMNAEAYNKMLDHEVLTDIDVMCSDYGYTLGEDLIISSQMGIDEATRILAIDVAKIPKLHALVYDTDEPLYLGVYTNSIHKEAAVKALEYLIDG